MRRACSLWGWVWLAGTMGSAFGGSAAEVLDRAVGAHGGAWALARLADVTLEGRITYPSRGLQELVLRAEIRAPDRVRTEVTGPGVTRLYVTDGTYAWVVEKGSKRALTVRDVAGRFCELNPPVGFLAAARDGRLPLVHLGRSVEADRTLDWLETTLSGAAIDGIPLPERRYRIGVDAGSGLVSRVLAYGRSADGRPVEEPEVFDYTEFFEAGGIVFAGRVEHRLHGVLLSEWRIEKVRFEPLGEIFGEP